MSYIPQPKNIFFDFINTDTTKAACKAKGLVFNDDTTLFATRVSGVVGATQYIIDGTWANVAGEGLLPTVVATANHCSAFTIPLLQPDYILTIEIKHAQVAVAETAYLFFGDFTDSNHSGYFLQVRDNSVAAYQFQAMLTTNSGSDSATVRYTGVALANPGTQTYKLKHQNSCISCFDAQDAAWHDYEGHPSLKSYNGNFLIFLTRTAAAVAPATIYYRSLTLEYI